MATNMHRNILITGASGGLGGALALEYASPTTTLILHGRCRERLASLADRCRDKGATVCTEQFDLRDRIRFRDWLLMMNGVHPIDLIFANAGMNINTGPQNQGEDWEEVQALLEVNIVATIATVHLLLPSMRARGAGQIAIISSLAAWRGLPETPSYSASKAAVKAYGEAMRDAVAVDGVKINVVMPGYVHSQMAYDMPGPKPFMWSAEKAARFIRRGLHANRARISFPFPLNLGCWLLAGIHPSVSGWVLKRLNFNR